MDKVGHIYIYHHYLSLKALQVQPQINTCAFETAYDKNGLSIKVTYSEEYARQFRVQVLLLEFERDDLYRKLAGYEELMEDFEIRDLRVQAYMDVAATNHEKATWDLRVRTRENETLKVSCLISEFSYCEERKISDTYQAELMSLQGLTSNSASILTENHCLVKELASLKLEMDHLRSQAASRQLLLSEKLELERQLSSAYAKLENQERTTNRVQIEEERWRLEGIKVEVQVKNLEAELKIARDQRERAEREAQQVSSYWQGERKSLESRLDEFRGKLRISQEQLKALQENPRLGFPVNDTESGYTTITRVKKNDSVPLGKRNLADLDVESTIGTPGDYPQIKKFRTSITAPGGKSAFSITPYLCRSTSVALESPSDLICGEASTKEITACCDSSKEKKEVDSVSASTIEAGLGALTEIDKVKLPRVSGFQKGLNSKKPCLRAATGQNSRVNPKLEEVLDIEENYRNNTTAVNHIKGNSNRDLGDGKNQRADITKKSRKVLRSNVTTSFCDNEVQSASRNQRFKKLRSHKNGLLLRTALSSTLFNSISPLKRN